MAEGFEKITHSDNQLYGERKLLLCGFDAKSQTKFLTLLEMVALKDLPVVWVASNQDSEILADLMELPAGSGTGTSSNLPRAIIVAGISENELHRLMNGCRKTGMKKALWAVLTETSRGWPLSRLLKELEAERKTLSGK